MVIHTKHGQALFHPSVPVAQTVERQIIHEVVTRPTRPGPEKQRKRWRIESRTKMDECQWLHCYRRNQVTPNCMDVWFLVVCAYVPLEFRRIRSHSGRLAEAFIQRDKQLRAKVHLSEERKKQYVYRCRYSEVVHRTKRRAPTVTRITCYTTRSIYMFFMYYVSVVLLYAWPLCVRS